MAVRTSTASSSHTASSADTAVATRRRAGVTLLVRSSVRPASNAGKPQASRMKACSPAARSRNQITHAPASAPSTMPTPPMRGTGME
jgi:hypothetical protein